MNKLLLIAPWLCLAIPAQSIVLFDFNNAPVYTPFPINVTAGGVTAHLSGTGQGYSIQSTNTAPVVPIGFTGNFIYPSSIYGADLLVSFTQTITHFQIQYAPDELGCDDSCRMRVTAYRGTTLVGTNTTTAANPGTYPVETLSCTFAAGFDNVVVHYDLRPPTCQDYGVIFLADNMSITLAPAGSYAPFGAGCAGSLPVSHLTAVQPPRLGSTLQVQLDNLPSSAAYLLTGWSNTTSGFGALPFNAAPLGMPGCSAYCSIDAANLVIGAGGTASFPMTIPNLVGLAGATFYQQALVLDANVANTLHAVLSTPARAVVGQ